MRRNKEERATAERPPTLPLRPGERLVDGRVRYSAAWLGEAPEDDGRRTRLGRPRLLPPSG